MRWLALIAWLPAWLVAAEPLRLPEVLTSVKERYPPLLIAMIEQDIAAGRLRQADGAFDLGFALRAGITPKGYYDGETTDVAAQHPTVVADLIAKHDAWWKECRPLMVNENAVGPAENPFKVMYREQMGK